MATSFLYEVYSRVCVTRFHRTETYRKDITAFVCFSRSFKLGSLPRTPESGYVQSVLRVDCLCHLGDRSDFWISARQISSNKVIPLLWSAQKMGRPHEKMITVSSTTSLAWLCGIHGFHYRFRKRMVSFTTMSPNMLSNSSVMNSITIELPLLRIVPLAA